MVKNEIHVTSHIAWVLEDMLCLSTSIFLITEYTKLAFQDD